MRRRITPSLASLLQDLGDPTAEIDGLAICSALGADENSSAIILSWASGEKAPRALAHSFESLEGGRVSHLLTEFIFLNIENIYFSEEWWSGLPKAYQGRVRRLAATTLPDAQVAPTYSRALLSPSALDRFDWQVAT